MHHRQHPGAKHSAAGRFLQFIETKKANLVPFEKKLLHFLRATSKNRNAKSIHPPIIGQL